MPRRSRRLNPPCLLDGLSDDLVLRLFSRAPFMTHGTLHVVCRRLKTLLRSPEFATTIDGSILLGGDNGFRYGVWLMYKNAAWSLVAEGREVAQVTIHSCRAGASRNF